MICSRFIVIAASALLLVACQSTSSLQLSGAAETPNQSEVRAAGRDWDRLFNSGDAAGLAALYAEDVISMPPNNATVSGRKAVQAEFESFFASNVARHETIVDQILDQRDLTIEVARYRLTFRPRAGGPEVVESGRHIEIRRKVDGQWKIVLEIWNSDTPPQK